MSLRSIGVLISLTVAFSSAIPENRLLNNESIAPMNDDYRLDNETRLSIDFIRMKEEEFQPGPEKEAVVILGNHFAGKSTLSLLLTDGEIKSVEEHSDYYFVDENNRICRSRCNFTLPVIDRFNNITYYDWSGFGNTLENLSEDVLTSHLLKKFSKSEKSVKFVFAISEVYFDITCHTRIDRAPEWLAWNCPFLEFVERASNLFLNIDKYRNAIGLVVTKATMIYDEETEALLPDETNISNAVFYLTSLRNGLTDYLNNNDSRSTGYNLKSWIEFIDILLEKKKDQYKIGVFMRPIEGGPVNELTDLKNEKNAIRSIIGDQLQFVKSDPNDFWYAVTEAKKKTDLFKKLESHLK